MKLQDLSFRLLAILIERGGDVVTREEVRQRDRHICDAGPASQPYAGPLRREFAKDRQAEKLLLVGLTH